MPETAVFFNPFAEGYAANPYPHYAELRSSDPVHQSPFGSWFLFSYDDVRRILRDPTVSVEEGNAHPTILTEMAQEALGDRFRTENDAMLAVDPPRHTRLRRLVSKAFTPRMIERLRPRIQDLVDGSLDVAAWDGGLELMDDYAFPLPFVVITELLGMPPTDTIELRRLSGLLVRSLEPVADPATLGEIAQADREMEQLVMAAIEWKRARPADDLLSALIAAEEDGDRLTTAELMAQVALLYVAGHETTVNLIGNGVLGLLHHPDQQMLLREDPSLDAVAVDELLRYDSPVQMSRRITLTEVEVGDKTIEPGAFVVVGLASANRDPQRWGPTADNIDLRRADATEHVSFGGGHHHCLGAALARLEGQIAISSLVRRFPTIEVMEEPTWNGRLNLRGLSSLKLRIRSTASA